MAIYRYDWDPPIEIEENYSTIEFAYKQVERKRKFKDIALLEGIHLDTPPEFQDDQEHRIAVFPSTEGEYTVMRDYISLDGLSVNKESESVGQHIGPECPLVAITSDFDGIKLLHRVVIYQAQSNPGT